MKYVCLIYSERARLDALPKHELDDIMQQYLAFTRDIRSSGHYLAGDALQTVKTAKTVRVRDGVASTTDGPFAETKEQLGGFYVIEAKDLNEAIQLAARIPGARWGSVEVRPVMETGQS